MRIMQALAFLLLWHTMFRAATVNPGAAHFSAGVVMDKPNPQDDSSRRDFLKGLTTLPLLAMLQAKPSPAGPAALSTAQTAAAPAAGKDGGKFVAIQIGGRSFVDEGVEKVLDVLQEKAGVNVLM